MQRALDQEGSRLTTDGELQAPANGEVPQEAGDVVDSVRPLPDNVFVHVRCPMNVPSPLGTIGRELADYLSKNIVMDGYEVKSTEELCCVWFSVDGSPYTGPQQAMQQVRSIPRKTFKWSPLTNKRHTVPSRPRHNGLRPNPIRDFARTGV